jgi:predicted TIM-barrel fold metal-dependent hydrolase
MAIQMELERPVGAPKLGYPAYDADGHLYENADAFRRHLPKKFHKDFQYVQVDGRTKLAILGKLSEYIPNPTFEVVAAPGSHEPWFRANNVEGKTLRELTGDPLRFQPEFNEPEARLKLLDEQGVHGQLIFPTLASVIESHMGNNVELMAACVHSLNAWTVDEWSFNYKDRLFACAYISLADVELACQELDFALEHGAKHILVRPAPVPGVLRTRSPGLPEFDRFWAKVNESGIFVSLHVSESGYSAVTNWWGSVSGGAGFSDGDPLRSCIDNVSRAIEDMLSALIAHGVMRRFPNIRWVSAENGSLWVEHLTKVWKRAYGQQPQAFGRVDPVETFHDKVFVEPFYEEDLDELKEYMPAERILFGSDWPHAEGLARPLDFLHDVKNFTPDEQRKVMSSNLKGLLEGKR